MYGCIKVIMPKKDCSCSPVFISVIFAKDGAIKGNLEAFYLIFLLLIMRPLLLATCIKLSRLLLYSFSDLP